MSDLEYLLIVKNQQVTERYNEGHSVKFLRFRLRLSLSLTGQMAIWRAKLPFGQMPFSLSKSLTYPNLTNGYSASVFLPNCHSAVRAWMQTEPAVFRKHVKHKWLRNYYSLLETVTLMITFVKSPV